MARDIKLRDDSDSTACPVSNHILDVGLSVEAGMNAGQVGGERRELLALHAETAMVRGVKVQDIQLVCSHGIH